LEAFAELIGPTSGEIYARLVQAAPVTTAEDFEALFEAKGREIQIQPPGPLGDETEMEIHR